MARPKENPAGKDALTARRPSLEELLPSRKLRLVFDETAAGFEAARFLRRVRESSGLKQGEVAKTLGISQARISAIESGEGRDGPSYALIRRYLTACGRDFSLEQGLLPPGSDDTSRQVPLKDVTEVVDSSGRRVGALNALDVVAASGDHHQIPVGKVRLDLLGLRFFIKRESLGSAVSIPTPLRSRAAGTLAQKARIKERG